MHFDALYHDVFADTTMTTMLLESFLPAPIVALLDLKTLTLLNSKNYTKDRHLRTGDLLFTVHYRNATRCMGVRLSLEAQSNVDEWMPVRALEYALLHWNQIRLAQQKTTVRQRRRRKKRTQKTFLPVTAPSPVTRLPAIISLVVFSGDADYSAPTDVHGCIDVPQDAAALLDFCPQFKQIVVNIKALDTVF